MAAAIIPLIAGLAPLIPALIRNVEGLFGPKTGRAKFETVSEMVLTAARQLSAAGKLPGVPDDVTIAAMVETEVQRLKRNGQLTGQPIPPASDEVNAGIKLMLTGALQVLAATSK